MGFFEHRWSVWGRTHFCNVGMHCTIQSDPCRSQRLRSSRVSFVCLEQRSWPLVGRHAWPAFLAMHAVTLAENPVCTMCSAHPTRRHLLAEAICFAARSACFGGQGQGGKMGQPQSQVTWNFFHRGQRHVVEVSPFHDEARAGGVRCTAQSHRTWCPCDSALRKLDSSLHPLTTSAPTPSARRIHRQHCCLSWVIDVAAALHLSPKKGTSLQPEAPKSGPVLSSAAGQPILTWPISHKPLGTPPTQTWHRQELHGVMLRSGERC